MKKVSDDQIVGFILAYWTERGFAPSITEVTKGVGLASSGSLYKRLRQLREDGAIAYSEGIPRTVRVVA